jgi:hypothetical protein
MFEYLADLSDRIVVTGPQRSGTTVATQMIAHDTGYQYVDELDFDGVNLMFFSQRLSVPRVVLQAPALLKVLVDHPPPDVLIVLMRRSLDEIHESEDRIRRQMPQGGGLDRVLRRWEMVRFGMTEGDVAAAKYAYWDANRPANSIEISYESLAEHWAFVEKAERANFHLKQTSVDAMTIASEDQLQGPLWMTAVLGPPPPDGRRFPSLELYP